MKYVTSRAPEIGQTVIGDKKTEIVIRVEPHQLELPLSHPPRYTVWTVPDSKFVTVGYARVSTTDQTGKGQVEELQEARADLAFVALDTSGGTEERKELFWLLEALPEGATILVSRYDRLSRSLIDLLEIFDVAAKRGLRLESLNDPALDARYPAGRLVLQLFGAFAEYEREMIKERARAGLRAAKKRGVHCGRPRALTGPQVRELNRRVGAGEWTAADAAAYFNVSKSTVYRLLEEES